MSFAALSIIISKASKSRATMAMRATLGEVWLARRAWADRAAATKLDSRRNRRAKRRRLRGSEGRARMVPVEALVSARLRYAKDSKKAAKDRLDAKPLVSKSFRASYPNPRG